MQLIIVPLDGSAYAERAIGFARVLADATNAQLILTQVVERPWAAIYPPDLPTLLEQAAAGYLNDVAAKVDTGSVTTLVLHGHPADALCAFAQHHADAVLVMSSHGRGGLGRAAFGSVADKVVRGAMTPVVIVPAASGSGISPLTEVVVALDGAPLAESALPPAVELARATRATLRLVRVVTPVWESFSMYGAPDTMLFSDTRLTELQQQADDEARTYLATVAGTLGQLPGGVTQALRSGRPADQLLRLTAELPSAMLVMTTHGRGGLRRWALGSVTTELVQRSCVPVMVVPSATSAEPATDSAGGNAMQPAG